jgi:uracil-DNA glycosylase family 4
MDQAQLARLVMQHAQTARLMGVDFVPVYRRGGGEPAQVPRTDAGIEGERAVAARPEPPLVEVVARQPSAPGPIDSGSAALSRSEAPSIEIPLRSRAPADVEAALAMLRQRYEADAPHRAFVTAHTNIVFGEGDPCARLMFIGEAPGAEEDRTGRPFVGRAGQLLEKMIGAMGLARQQVYIANVLKTRPPDNATPTSEEVRLCAPYLYAQIALIQPEVIVTLGLPASRALLNSVESMSRLRGRWASFAAPAPCGRAIPVMPTYHPAFLLRSYTPENRAKVWSDLRMVMDRLGMKAGGPPAA